MDLAAELVSAKEALVTNADYAATSSRTKALNLHAALIKLIGLAPEMAAIGRDGGQEIRNSIGEWRQLKNEVERWLASNPDTSSSSAGGLTYADFSDGRR